MPQGFAAALPIFVLPYVSPTAYSWFYADDEQIRSGEMESFQMVHHHHIYHHRDHVPSAHLLAWRAVPQRILEVLLPLLRYRFLLWSSSV